MLCYLVVRPAIPEIKYDNRFFPVRQKHHGLIQFFTGDHAGIITSTAYKMLRWIDIGMGLHLKQVLYLFRSYNFVSLPSSLCSEGIPAFIPHHSLGVTVIHGYDAFLIF